MYSASCAAPGITSRIFNLPGTFLRRAYPCTCISAVAKVDYRAPAHDCKSSNLRDKEAVPSLDA
eukprot:3348895-Amphidinium_carterae.1